MFERILLPTDGSPGMGSAVEHAFHQAEVHGATIHACYVVDVRAYVVLPDEQREGVRSVLVEAGTGALEGIEELGEASGVDVVTHLEEGVPHEAILAVAAEADVDLVVMGTRGRAEDEQRVVGSVAEGVIRGIDVPVLAAPLREGNLDDPDPTVPEAQRRYIG